MNHQESSREIVSTWLMVATKGLTPLANDRINPEIEAHFFDAVERHLADELSQTDAQLAALNELGDADAAGKRFRQKHLTVREAKHMEGTLKNSKSFYWLFHMVFYGIIITPPHSAIFFRLAMTVYGCLSAIACYETRRKNHRPHPGLIFSLNILAFASMLIGVLPSSFQGSKIWPTLNILALFLWLGYGYLFWSKLRKTGNLGQEKTPSANS